MHPQTPWALLCRTSRSKRSFLAVSAAQSGIEVFCTLVGAELFRLLSGLRIVQAMATCGPSGQLARCRDMSAVGRELEVP